MTFNISFSKALNVPVTLSGAEGGVECAIAAMLVLIHVTSFDSACGSALDDVSAVDHSRQVEAPTPQ